MRNILAALIITCLCVLGGCGSVTDNPGADLAGEQSSAQSASGSTAAGEETARESGQLPENITAPTVNLNNIPEYSGAAFTAVNGNVPYFTERELSKSSFESYSDLDYLDRCGVALACVGSDIMPTGERGNIGQIKPSGWHTVRYDNVDGKYLYNRCHLIGFQLTGENANEKNLITGTRYMNVEGMLPFENMVADYVKETNNHVMYRVTPVFEGNNLVASGVLMEGYSVEDGGAGICFNVFCYNVQPGIEIDYLTGESRSANVGGSEAVPAPEEPKANEIATASYIGNKNTMKFHVPQCGSVGQMKEENKEYLNCTRDEAVNMGYVPCGNCKP